VIHITAFASKNRYQVPNYRSVASSNLCHRAMEELRDVAASGLLFLSALLRNQPLVTEAGRVGAPPASVTAYHSFVRGGSERPDDTPLVGAVTSFRA
jgi:hypothetical protein